MHLIPPLAIGVLAEVKEPLPDILVNLQVHFMPAVAVALLHIGFIGETEGLKLAMEEQEVAEMLFLQEIVELEVEEAQEIYVPVAVLVYVLYVGMIRSLKRKEESA